MRETGIVVELNGDIAKVSVERVVNPDKPDVTEKTLVEVANLCNAKINDEVIINKTTLKLMRNRSVVTLSGTLIAFAIGSGIGNAVLPRLGLSLDAPFSLGIGLVLGCIFLLVSRKTFRKNRLPALAAYTVEKAAPTTT
jgi:hypothetical protein